jgi:hypothetical protein
LELSRSLQDVQFSTSPEGEIEISGMREPPSVYASEGFQDPMESVSRPTLSIPSLSTTPSIYRNNSAVPDSLQQYITAEEEMLAMDSRRITRSMDRPPTLHSPAEASLVPPEVPADGSTPVVVPPRFTDSPPPVYWESLPPVSPTAPSADEPIDYDTEDDVGHFAALSLYEHALASSPASPSVESGVHHIPSNYDELLADMAASRAEMHHLECVARATANRYSTNYLETLLFSSKGYTPIVNPFPAREVEHVLPFPVPAPSWHSSADPIIIDSSNLIRNASEEMAHLSYGKTVMNDPELSARWSPVVAKEMAPYIGTCLHAATPEWLAEHPDINICEWICVLGEKRDATTGLHLKDKARFAIDGSIEIRAGKHPDPSKYYCNTLGSGDFITS